MTYFSICLFFVLFLHEAACLKFKGGDFILLDGEPENLLYENTFVHEWHLCRVNTSVISPYEYTKKGYINENCSNKNWDNKHPYLKYAWFYAGVPDTNIPTCDPLSAADSYSWNCEKNLLPNEVTPYRNCTPVCNEGYTLQHNVTARCSVNLTWTWFGDKDKQFCDKMFLPDSTQAPTDRHLTSVTSTRPPSSAASHQPTSTTPLEKQTSTFSSVTTVTCTNTTVLTKDGGKRNTQSTNVIDIVYIITGAIGGVLMLLIIVTVVYCKRRSRRQITSSSVNYKELPVTSNIMMVISPQSQNSSGRGNCFSSCVQEESSFSDSSQVSHSGSSSLTESSNFPNKNGKSYQESKEKLVDFDSGDTKQRTQIDVDSAETNDRKKQEINSEVDMLECRKINSINENDICLNAMLCGRSQPEEKETDDYSSIFDGELLLQETMSEHDSTTNTLEEPTLFLTKDEEKKTLLQTCGTQEEANEEVINPFKNCDLSCEHKGNQYIHLNRKLETDPYIDVFLETDVPGLDDLQISHHSSGLVSDGHVNFDRKDMPKTTEYDKNVNVDGSQANSLHAMDPPSEMNSAQPYAAAAAAEFHPLVYGNHCVMPKPDSFDYSGSSSSSPSHQKESKTLKHQNSRDNKLAAHASIRNSQTCPSQGGRSSCDIDAMNNQVGNQNVSVGRLRSTNLNNSDNSRDQNTRRANSNSNKECEPVQRRLPSPLLLPQTRPVPSNRQSIETDGQDTCPGSEDISQECHSLPVVPAVVCLSNYRTKSNEDRVSSTCTMPISKAKDELSLTFFVRLGYHIDPDSFYGPLKSWFGLSLQVLKLSEEEVQSIRHHSIGNPDKGHFFFTLGKYTGQGLYISDIVQYFVQCDSLREDVIQFIKQHHTDCGVCNRLYLTVTQSFSESTEDIRRISDEHHKKRNN